MTLQELQRIKRWQAAHGREHPVECRAWNVMLTLWVVGWVGWIPAFAFGLFWMAPLLVAAGFAPTLYVAWRARAHQQQRVRCDWLEAG